MSRASRASKKTSRALGRGKGGGRKSPIPRKNGQRATRETSEGSDTKSSADIARLAEELENIKIQLGSVAAIETQCDEFREFNERHAETATELSRRIVLL
jgi:hypothetical protein